jgi:PAS domain S-box-containing protein
MSDMEPEIAIDDNVMVVTDLYGALVSVSGAVEEMFGYSESELVGRSVEMLIPAGLRERHRDHMARYSRRPHARTMGIGMELNAAHADGSEFPIEVSLRVISGKGQDLVRAVIQRAGRSGDVTPGNSDLSARIRQIELTSGDISEIYGRVLELASETYSGRPVGIWRYQEADSGYVLERAVNMPEGMVGSVVPVSDNGLITQAAFTQGVSVIPVDSDAPSKGFMVKNGFPGGIAAAIGGRYEPYGAISVFFTEADQLTVDDTGDLQTIATELSRFVLSALSEEALERESALQAKLAEIGRIFSSSPHIGNVYRDFTALVDELIPHRRITLSEIDQSTRTINTRYAINSDGTDIEGWETGTLHPLEGTSSESMSVTREGLFINFEDPEEFSKTLPGAPGPEAGLTGVLNVPLVVSGSVIGALTLNSGEGQTFTEGSLRLGERIAAQISGSFLSAALSESLEKEAARSGNLNRIDEIIGSNLEFAEIFDEFAETFAGMIAGDLVVITDVDDPADTRVDYLTFGKDVPNMDVGVLAGSITGLAASSKSVVAFAAETYRDDPDLSSGQRESLRSNFELSGMSAWIAAPMQYQGEVISVLHVLANNRVSFDDGDREFMGAVALRVANAVANSRLHEAAKEYARRQGLLAQISREIGSSLDTSETFDAFAALMADLVPVDRVAISNVDVSNQTAETLYSSRSAKFKGIESTGYRTTGTTGGYVADIGETVVINDPATGARRFESWRDKGRSISSSVTLPLGRDGEFARVFQVSSVQLNAYGPEEVETIEQIASQVAGAVANQQLYRRSIELGQERERSIRLEAERSRLEGANEAKNEFLNLLSHELKTPLTSIIAFADLLGRSGGDNFSDRQVQHLGVIQRNAWHLDSLIQDLVDVSRIERGMVEIFTEESDLGALVTGVLEGQIPKIEEMGQMIDFVAPESAIRANVDRQRVVQIVSNLVSNASKYSPAQTTISVGVGSNDEVAFVRVEDEGPGIPEEDRDMVFDLFHRVDNEVTRQVPGTGQGLYLVKQLVELHGGQVRIESRTDAAEKTGTTITVEFPLV